MTHAFDLVTPAHGSQWEDAGMVAAYHHRPPYPGALFGLLADLATSGPVLDLACGTGEIARPLAALGLDVDAVDRSRAMLEAGRRRGGAEGVRWIHGPAETAPLRDAYGLATAGEGIHWLAWPRLFPRLFARTPRLAVVVRTRARPPWRDELEALIRAHVTLPRLRYTPLIERLRAFWDREGETVLPLRPFRQSVDAYLLSLHARNGLSRARMGEDAARRFDETVRTLVSPHAEEGALRLEVGARLVWGRPR